MQNHQPNWLNWARQLQAIGQTGLIYAEPDSEEQSRYQQLHQLAIEIFAAHVAADQDTLAGWLTAQPGYVTPKSEVRIAAFRGDDLLLVPVKAGRWCLPGGWAVVGDTPKQTATRHLQEITGLVGSVRKLIGIWDTNISVAPFSIHHTYRFIFLCDLADGDLRHGLFFARNSTPPLVEGLTTIAQLAECFAHHADPSRPAAFDQRNGSTK